MAAFVSLNATGAANCRRNHKFSALHAAGRPMAAMASMASEFWMQFGVVMMADVSTAKDNVKRVFYVRLLNIRSTST